jgi:hypothetical protein
MHNTKTQRQVDTKRSWYTGHDSLSKWPMCQRISLHCTQALPNLPMCTPAHSPQPNKATEHVHWGPEAVSGLCTGVRRYQFGDKTRTSKILKWLLTFTWLHCIVSQRTELLGDSAETIWYWQIYTDVSQWSCPVQFVTHTNHRHTSTTRRIKKEDTFHNIIILSWKF